MTTVKAHEFRDLSELNLEPYVTRRVLPTHWGATQLLRIKSEFSTGAQKQVYLIFGELATLLRYIADSTPGEAPSLSSYHERSSRT